MSSKMLQFVATKKAMPAKRSADNRVADFDEIYNEFNAEAAETQASRCSQCGVPFCQVNCSRDLWPHLPAGSPVRRQLRDRKGV